MKWLAFLLAALAWFWVFWLLYPALMNILACWRPGLKPRPASGRHSDLGCIITAYRDLDIALPLVESLLHQQHRKFRIYLVADACPAAGTNWYAALHDPRFTLLRPDQALGSKVRSLQYARERFLRAHEAVVVFDPDNLAPADFLSKLDEVLLDGFWAVQGRRAAKNTDSTVAAADATGELYKNFIEREVPTRLGSSATIAGSGMAVKTSVWDAYMVSSRIAGPLSRAEVIPAEDKILQNYLVSQGLRIPFRWDAVLYDEKVETDAQVQRQRTRWLYAYFQNIPHAAGIALRGLGRLDRNALIFGLYALVPPLVTLLGVAVMLAPGQPADQSPVEPGLDGQHAALCAEPALVALPGRCAARCVETALRAAPLCLESGPVHAGPGPGQQRLSGHGKTPGHEPQRRRGRRARHLARHLFELHADHLLQGDFGQHELHFSPHLAGQRTNLGGVGCVEFVQGHIAFVKALPGQDEVGVSQFVALRNDFDHFQVVEVDLVAREHLSAQAQFLRIEQLHAFLVLKFGQFYFGRHGEKARRAQADAHVVPGEKQVFAFGGCKLTKGLQTSPC
jgi:hypothetical protein